jgi:predicted transcriptional regulator
MVSTQTIQVDQATAQRLEARARELGLSVPELIAKIASLQPVEVSDDEIAELDRQVAAIDAGEPTVPHEDVERWLKTWGTPDFKPWRDR